MAVSFPYKCRKSLRSKAVLDQAKRREVKLSQFIWSGAEQSERQRLNFVSALMPAAYTRLLHLMLVVGLQQLLLAVVSCHYTTRAELSVLQALEASAVCCTVFSQRPRRFLAAALRL